MSQHSHFLRSFTVIAAASWALAAHAAPTVSNGGFDNGTLEGWTTYLGANGSLGVPTVALFDTVEGVYSHAARLQAGQVSYVFNQAGGGGLSQGFFAQTDSLYAISADIASLSASSNYTNGDGGTISLVLDGNTLATYSFGDIRAEQVLRSSLSYQGWVAAGTHELSIAVSRNYLSNATPYQFIDNVKVSSIPEPDAGILLTLGLGFMAVWRVRGGGKAA